MVGLVVDDTETGAVDVEEETTFAQLLLPQVTTAVIVPFGRASEWVG